ncbi:hypothetical protein EON82_22455, partial [bacterium]
MLSALMFSLVTASVVSAGLLVSTTHYSRAFSEARSESALLLAEGGVNDELAKLAEGVGNPEPSDPTVASGETKRYPGENHAVYGRKGNVTGAANENFWVCTSNNDWAGTGQAPVPWDGVQEKFWVTSTAFVKGSWRRTAVQVAKSSVFGEYAVYTPGSDGDTVDNVDVETGTTTITGKCGTNGKVRCRTGASLSTGNCVNSNKSKCTSPQFNSSYVRPGCTISEKQTPYVYPRTTDVMKKHCGKTSSSDSSAWTYMKNNCDNDTGIYTYKSGATGSSINTSNCTRSTFSGTTCRNRSTSSTTSKGCWDYARTKPGTSGKVKTMIFQPGDYYFSSLQLAYDASTEMVIDPMAYASGGTPGQVRFWIYDSSYYADDDNIDLPVQMTKAGGTTDPDPALFRVYYAKDGCQLTLNRPSNCKDYNGNTLSGDFKFCGGIYAVTKKPNDPSPWTNGAKVRMCGTSGSSNGK